MRDKAPEETATVIPLFETVPYEHSMARLARATAGMEAAVMEQKEIIAAFRSKMAELREKTEQLGESCEFLHQTVGDIDMKPLRGKTLRLARIMEPSMAGPLCGALTATEST